MTHDPSAAFPDDPRTQTNMAEHQMIDLTRRMRKRAEDAEAIIEAVRTKAGHADYHQGPAAYRSCPQCLATVRAIGELVNPEPAPDFTPAPKPSELSEAHPAEGDL